MRRGATVGEQNRTHEVIRQCGGIVHSDDNIFFTNRYQFEHAASILLGVATVRVESAASPASATKEREPTPVAWYQPDNRNPGQSVTFDKAKRDRWPHLFPVPLYASPVATAKELPVYLTVEEIAFVMTELSNDHDGSDFEPECPCCTAYRKLAAMSPIQGEGEKPEQPNVHSASGDRTARNSAKEREPFKSIFTPEQREAARKAWPQDGEKPELPNTDAHLADDCRTARK
jgi:hypothetical protein